MFSINYYNLNKFFNENFYHLEKYKKNYIIYFLNIYYDRICRHLIVNKDKQLDKETILNMIISYIGIILENEYHIVEQNNHDTIYEDVKNYIENLYDNQYNLKIQEIMKKFNSFNLRDNIRNEY